MRNLFFSMFFLLAPLLGNLYFLYGVSWGDVAVMVVLVFFFFVRGCLDGVSLFAIFFLMILFFVVGGYYFYSFGMGVLPVARMIFYFFSFFVLVNFCKAEEFSLCLGRVYIFLAVLFSVMLVVQVFVYKIFGVVFVYIESAVDVEVNSVRALGVDAYGLRSGGVFKEPSYYAIFMIPALFYAAEAKKITLWAFFSGCVFFSTSVLGVLFVGLSFLRFLKYGRFFVFFQVSFCVVLFYFSFLFGMLPDRVLDTINGEGSLSVRVMEPFKLIFFDLEGALWPSFEFFNSISSNEGGGGLILCVMPLCFLVFQFLFRFFLFYIFLGGGG